MPVPFQPAWPVTKALPALSTAMPLPKSLALPP
jgi:hypothetical protein